MPPPQEAPQTTPAIPDAGDPFDSGSDDASDGGEDG
jgi:hypothetical protein